MAARITVTLMTGLLLSGCATYSFAPPEVDLSRVNLEPEKSDGNCGYWKKSDRGAKIEHDIAGAKQLLDNFTFAYRCSVKQAANGRQQFEVPAMLTALGGATAAAFGAGPNVAIAAGAAGAGLNGAKGYYSPRDKWRILIAANDAINCVRQEAYGVPAYGSSLLDQVRGENKGEPDTGEPEAGTSKPGDKDAGGATPNKGTKAPDRSPKSGGANVAISASEQYYSLVSGALLDIENIAAQRLNSVGTFAPSALISELEEISKKAEDAKAEQDKKRSAIKGQADAVAAETPTAPPATVEAKDKTGKTIVVEASQAADLVDSNNQLKVDVPAADLKKVAPTGGSYLTMVGDQPAVKVAAKPVPEPGASAAINDTLLYLDLLQPNLQRCVVRAKL